MIDFKSFQKALPAQIVELLELFNQKGFKAGVVGGVPRDYINQMRVGTDFDVELRPVEERGFLERFKEMALVLETHYEIREKGYSVYEVLFENCSLEFSLPRLEIFKDKVHHSNFKAKYIADRDHAQGFKRRDFTINAIMFEFWEGEWKLIDPLGGLGDMKNKNLRACDNQSFVKDPVRFLRAARFALKLNFVFDSSLSALLENMELVVSPHYLKMEALKSQKPLGFLRRCFELRPDHFHYGYLTPFAEIVERYEQEIKPESLRVHIGGALFLPLNVRSKLLKSLQEKDKGLIDLNLKEVNLKNALSKSLTELSKVSWVNGLLALFPKAGEFGKKRLNRLLQEEGARFDYDFIRKYNELEIQPDGNVPNPLKRYDVFQKKLKALL